MYKKLNSFDDDDIDGISNANNNNTNRTNINTSVNANTNDSNNTNNTNTSNTSESKNENIRHQKSVRLLLLTLFIISWFFLFLYFFLNSWSNCTVDNLESNLNPNPNSYESNNESEIKIHQLDCNSALMGKDSDCGLFAELCSSKMQTISSILFRCPATCCFSSNVYSPRQVGNTTVLYSNYVIGGHLNNKKFQPGNEYSSYIYRGDSFICAAAVHAGAISNIHGGLISLSLHSNTDSLELIDAIPSHRNNVRSVGFDGIYPFSFSFQDPSLVINSPSNKPNNSNLSNCYNLKFEAIFFNILFSLIFSILTFYLHPGLFFFTNAFATYWMVALISDTPDIGGISMSKDNAFSELISIAFGRFLPAIFIIICMYYVAAKPLIVNYSLSNDPSEKSFIFNLIPILFYFFGLWVTALFNYTFDRLPVDRLLWTDITQRPGAKITAASIFFAFVVCTVIQMRAICLYYKKSLLETTLTSNNEASPQIKIKFKNLLIGYFLSVLTIIYLGSIPELTLRLHHYFIGMYLIPATIVPSITSMLFQGLCLGLFVNGIAKWGFDSVLQTSDQLRRGELLNNKNQIARFVSIEKNAMKNNSSTDVSFFKDAETESQPYNENNFGFSIAWAKVNDPENDQLLSTYDSNSTLPSNLINYSLLVNDIEVYRGESTTYSTLEHDEFNNFFLKMQDNRIENFTDSTTWYFRIACVNQLTNIPYKYSSPAILFPNSSYYIPPISS